MNVKFDNIVLFRNLAEYNKSKKRLFDEVRRKLEEVVSVLKDGFANIVAAGKTEEISRPDLHFLERYTLFPPSIVQRNSSEHIAEDSSSLHVSNNEHRIEEDSPNDESVEADRLSYRSLSISDQFPTPKFSCIYIEPGKTRGKRGSQPQVTSPELSLDFKSPIQLINRRITKVRKYYSNDSEEMSLWIIGGRDFVGKQTNGQDLVFIENPNNPNSEVVEMTKLNGEMVFLKSGHLLLATDLNLNVIFEADISSVFEEGDSVTSMLSLEDENLLIIGTQLGTIIVLLVVFEEKSVVLKDRGSYSVKPIKSLFWMNFKAHEFAAAAQDSRLVLFKLNAEFGLEALRVFSYDMEIQVAVSFNKLALIAFSSGIVAIVELERGAVVYAYKLPLSEEGHPRVTWLGQFCLEAFKKKNSNHETLTEESFYEMINKVRFFARTSDDQLYIFGPVTNQRERVQQYTLFEPRSQEPRGRQPLEPVFEKKDDTVLIRFFRSNWADSTEDEEGTDKPSCLMHQVTVSVTGDSI